jgi:hypothetical protein
MDAAQALLFNPAQLTEIMSGQGSATRLEALGDDPHWLLMLETISVLFNASLCKVPGRSTWRPSATPLPEPDQ